MTFSHSTNALCDSAKQQAHESNLATSIPVTQAETGRYVKPEEAIKLEMNVLLITIGGAA